MTLPLPVAVAVRPVTLSGTAGLAVAGGVVVGRAMLLVGGSVVRVLGEGGGVQVDGWFRVAAGEAVGAAAMVGTGGKVRTGLVASGVFSGVASGNRVGKACCASGIEVAGGMVMVIPITACWQPVVTRRALSPSSKSEFLPGLFAKDTPTALGA